MELFYKSLGNILDLRRCQKAEEGRCHNKHPQAARQGHFKTRAKKHLEDNHESRKDRQGSDGRHGGAVPFNIKKDDKFQGKDHGNSRDRKQKDPGCDSKDEDKARKRSQFHFPSPPFSASLLQSSSGVVTPVTFICAQMRERIGCFSPHASMGRLPSKAPL